MSNLTLGNIRTQSALRPPLKSPATARFAGSADRFKNELASTLPKDGTLFGDTRSDVKLSDVLSRLDRGENVLLTGPDGSGKSTFMKTIMQAVAGRGGEVFPSDNDGEPIKLMLFDFVLDQLEDRLKATRDETQGKTPKPVVMFIEEFGTTLNADSDSSTRESGLIHRINQLKADYPHLRIVADQGEATLAENYTPGNKEALGPKTIAGFNQAFPDAQRLKLQIQPSNLDKVLNLLNHCGFSISPQAQAKLNGFLQATTGAGQTVGLRALLAPIVTKLLDATHAGARQEEPVDNIQTLETIPDAMLAEALPQVFGEKTQSGDNPPVSSQPAS